jgi:large subunit ribosomal protein L9|tara:strand:+ start:155 stop:613 length:459 start_codon:yes stop_codon:yes gene_type:complete
MEIILLENVIKLGKIGDLVKVKAGYGRNYLLKLGKALRASKENIDFVNKKKDTLKKKNNDEKKRVEVVANKVNEKTIIFIKESKDNGDIYGTIKPKEISNTIKENLNQIVEPSQIVIKDTINKIGIYKIEINLHSEIQTRLNIEVKKIDSTK